MLRIHLALVWLPPRRSPPELSTFDINFKMDMSNGALERPESAPNLLRMLSAQKPIDRGKYTQAVKDFVGKIPAYIC